MEEIETNQEDALVFAEDEAEAVPSDPPEAWRVLIVDDEPQVHDVTRLVLQDFLFENRPLSFLSAYSAREAREMLDAFPDVAVILLDVVMEEDDAGLRFIHYIREQLQNTTIRIILRTGQPGLAPERDIIMTCDINDYRIKTELTATALFTSMVVALRSYRDLRLIEKKQDELHLLVEAYDRFVPHEFLRFLEKENIVEVKLGDQIEKEMTILFSDIRDFTTLSEVMTPQENFNFINSYLSQMEPLISRNGGFIDKYIGDAIMALFPNSPNDGINAAIAMQRLLFPYNQGRVRAGYRPIKVGIGLHTGSLMLGTVGGYRRMDGTVISDAVNLASRIEGLTKLYGSGLILTEDTFARLGDNPNYHYRIIDRVVVRGKTRPVTIYEIFDGDAPEIIERKHRAKPIFEEALHFYANRRFSEAEQRFADVLSVNKDDHAAHIYLTRCRRFQDIPAWEGQDDRTYNFMPVFDR